MTRKRITIKSYLPSGDFAGVWPEAAFEGFSKELDAGESDCFILLNRPFDYAGQDLQLGNRVDIYVADLETIGIVDGEKLVYRGYISMISPRVDRSGDNIEVKLIGYYTRLSVDFLKDGSQTTLYTDAGAGLTTSSPGAAADLGLIMRAVIDRYRAESGDASIRWTPQSIPEVGETAFYVFRRKTYREALDIIKAMAPAGWHWYVDATGLVKFQEKGSSGAHSLAVGREISSLRVDRSLESVRNVFLVWNGETGSPIYKHYEDPGSIARYGRRASATVDPGIGDEDAADSLAARFIEDMRSPDVRVTIEVIDSNGGRGYDIESIEPGDTLTILNFESADSETVRAELAVTRIDYRPDGATVQAALVRDGVLDAQEAARRRLESAEATGIPESYS